MDEQYTPEELKEIAAAIIAGNGRGDLLIPHKNFVEDIFDGYSIFNQYNDIENTEDLIRFMNRLQRENPNFNVSPDKFVEENQQFSLEVDVKKFFGLHTERISYPIASRSQYNEFFVENPDIMRDMGYNYYDNLPNPELNPPFFSNDPIHFVEAGDGQGIYAAALAESPPNTWERTQETLAALDEANNEEPKVVYLAMLDYYPPSFIDGTGLAQWNNDVIPTTPEDILAAQNAFLERALKIYQAAESEQDGAGYQAIIDFVSASSLEQNYNNSYHNDIHGIMTAVQALDSFEREQTELGTIGDYQLQIYPVDVKEFDFVNYQLPEGLPILAWSISLVGSHPTHTMFVENQIANGKHVFVASGNAIKHRDETAYQRAEGAITVGGQSCLGSSVANLIISSLTDIAITNAFEEGDCQTVAVGTSANTPDVAGTILARAIADYEDNRNGKLNPADFQFNPQEFAEGQQPEMPPQILAALTEQPAAQTSR